jgi:hypothetical protein
VISEWLDPTSIIRMAGVSKKTNVVYSQDIIWWIHLHRSFPELRYDYLIFNSY